MQQLIGDMEGRWERAGLAYDTATIGRMLANEYFYADNYQIENRADVLRDDGTRDSVFIPISITDSDRVVRVYDNAAVVTAIARSTGRNKRTGEEYHSLGRYTETWIRRNGQWQVVAGAYHDIQLPKAALLEKLVRVEQDYGDMFTKRDSAAFDRLVSDSVTFAAGTDSVETKSQLWKDIKESDFRTNVHQVDRAFVVGDVGTVNGTIDRGRSDGSTTHLRYTNTWVFRNSWRLIARQLVPAESGAR